MQLKIVFEGASRVLDYSGSESILDAALEAGLSVPWSCREGICRSCVARLHSGAVDMLEDAGLSDSDKDDDLILTCQSYPSTDDSLHVEYLDVEEY